MKPLKLTMSAYGSYAGVEVIDFSQIDHGIFLITGDTGAGKTTIFDAIVYALFDRSSAGAREPSDMRSQYAAADVPTYVEFTFSYGKDSGAGDAQIYTIRRNPKYSRISKRRDKDGNLKETVEQPSVELTMPDGKQFVGKVRETNEKIVEIVGLDADQFTQIAMLAQGEFMKLLQAPSNKRKEIFGRIFDTKIYWQLQEYLKREAKSRYIELEDNKKYCEIELKAVKNTAFIDNITGGIESVDDKPDEYVFTDINGTELLQQIETLIHKGESAAADKNNSLAEMQNRINDIKDGLDKATVYNGSLTNLAKAVAQKVEIEEKKQYIEDLKSKVKNAQKAEKVSVSEKKCIEHQTMIKECNGRICEYEKQQENIKNELIKLEESKEAYENKRKQREPELLAQIAALDEEMPLYEELKKLNEELGIRQKKLENSAKKEATEKKRLEAEQVKLVEKHKITVGMLEEYQRLNDMFIAEQAGIMAASLQEGMPCPVCGSTTHPDKRKLSDSDVSQAVVNHAKAKWQEADKEEIKCSENIDILKSGLEDISAATRQISTLCEGIKIRLEGHRARLRYDSDVQAKLHKTELEAEYAKLKKETEAAVRKWQETKDRQVKLDGVIVSEREQSSRLEEELEVCEADFNMVLSIQGFDDITIYKAALMTESDITKAERLIESYKEQVVRNSEAINQLLKYLVESEYVQTQNIGDKKAVVYIQEIVGDISSDSADKLLKMKVDMSDMETEIDKLQNIHSRMHQEILELYAINQRNSEAYDKLKVLYEKREKLKAEYMLYSNLDKTANGNLSGSAKLDFQTYIQRRYFEAIIHEANKRLIKMSSNQFILQCRSFDKLGSQGAVGLDLDVYSLVNDKTRDVKTLSGGESFMAALSMALGMADVIQNTVGKISLDTMFVDEGFGSLDDESRTQAIKILQELAGDRRVIGIISHVTELKEQIDNKLVVEKNEKGSYVYWK